MSAFCQKTLNTRKTKETVLHRDSSQRVPSFQVWQIKYRIFTADVLHLPYAFYDFTEPNSMHHEICNHQCISSSCWVYTQTNLLICLIENQVDRNLKTKKQPFIDVLKIGVLKNLAIIIRKHLCCSLFIKKRLQHRCFSANIVKFLRTPCFAVPGDIFSYLEDHALQINGLASVYRDLRHERVKGLFIGLFIGKSSCNKTDQQVKWLIPEAYWELYQKYK